MQNICWNSRKQRYVENDKNFKNITQKLNYDLHERQVNGIARDFKNMIAWNNCINFSTRYQNHQVNSTKNMKSHLQYIFLIK